VLAHYSPYAKQKLVDERAAILCITNGTKEPMRWIYNYMQTEESDPVGLATFESLTFESLVLLYTHAAFLQYDSLMARVVGRLKGKYHDSLPPVNDIKTFSVFVPPLFDYTVGILAHEMANPWACNYTAYTEYAALDETFRVKLEETVQDLIAHRVEVGIQYYQRASNRHVQWSQQYYDNVAKDRGKTTKQGKKKPAVKLPVAADTKDGTTSATENKRRGRKPKTKQVVKPTDVSETFPNATHKSTADATKKKRATKDFKCYNCDVTGHLVRDCKAKKLQRVQHPAPACYNCNHEGHMSRDCTVQRPAPICYNCDIAGHLARDCLEPRKVDPREDVANASKPRNTTGRNRNFRRAQRERITYGIEVTGNGEGLRTCDREVRKGKLTRTGLVI
jgi:hypothetical protein